MSRKSLIIFIMSFRIFEGCFFIFLDNVYKLIFLCTFFFRSKKEEQRSCAVWRALLVALQPKKSAFFASLVVDPLKSRHAICAKEHALLRKPRRARILARRSFIFFLRKHFLQSRNCRASCARGGRLASRSPLFTMIKKFF